LKQALELANGEAVRVADAETRAVYVVMLAER
jgi:hypothetical protein